MTRDSGKPDRYSRFIYDENNPIQFKTKCHLCRFKFRGLPGCVAFPHGIPHALAIGDVMHDEPFEGDRGYRFEKRHLDKGSCSVTCKGREIVIPIKKIIELAPRCAFDSEPSVHLSYRHFLAYFRDRQTITAHDVVIAASFVYSWMPRCLDFRELREFDNLAVFMNAVRNGHDLDTQTLSLFKGVINNSLIGTSKLLHFAAPEKYPIIDSKVAKFLEEHGQRIDTDDSDCYVAYTCACRRAVEHPHFENIRGMVCRAVGFQVSAIRALELIMFLTAKAKCT
jgi:hypothetical protein